MRGLLVHGLVGNHRLVPLPRGCNADTGLPHEQMAQIKNGISLRSTTRTRHDILLDILHNGARWERHTHEIIAAVSKRYRRKRIGNKKAKQEEKTKHSHDLLPPEQATEFRAMAARANYLALDRPDVAFATKELCRCFASPNGQAMDALKRLARYLVGVPRLVWRFRYQPSCDEIVTYVDTDFAGCLSTRRSTSGGAGMRGRHLVKHWSLTQGTVTLSSAEAELHGICKGPPSRWGSSPLPQIWGSHGHCESRLTRQLPSGSHAAVAWARYDILPRRTCGSKIEHGLATSRLRRSRGQERC